MPELALKAVASGLFVVGMLLFVWGLWLGFNAAKPTKKHDRLTYGKDGK